MDDAQQIAAFVAAADELHLGRAAATLGLTRATLARRLRALESRLDLCLVNRRHRCRIALTPAGEALLPDARAMVAAAARVASTGRAIRDGRVGVVRVAVISESDERVEALIDVLQDVHPAWTIDVRRMDRLAAGRSMAVGGLEVVIGRQVPPVPTGVTPGDLRPCRHDRMGRVRIGAGEPGWLDVAWRKPWSDLRWATRGSEAVAPTDAVGAAVPVAGTDAISGAVPVAGTDAISGAGSVAGADAAGPSGPPGAEHARALVLAALRLRDDDLDRRYPRRAERRRAVEARRAELAAEQELREREDAEFGPGIAMGRARDRALARLAATQGSGGTHGHDAVGPRRPLDYWCMDESEQEYWATFLSEAPPA